MKRFLFIGLFIYILEMVVSIYFERTMFLPLFGYFYVINTARQFFKEKERFLFCFLSGMLYDLLVTTTPFMNLFLFPFLYFIVQKIDIYLLKNKITFLILFLLELFFYRTFTYFILVLIQYQSFLITKYIDSLLYSISLNLVFVVIYNFLFLKEKRNSL